MKTPSVLIVDYGVGNIFNIKRAFESLGATVTVSNDPAEIAVAERIVLPGVGAFAAGMAGLSEFKLVEPLREAALERKVPFFGVCLGMQLLMDYSEENGHWQGLGFIPGAVTRLAPQAQQTAASLGECKIPHMGWNTVKQSSARGQEITQGTIFSGITLPEYFYFVHSYFVTPTHAEHALTETSYGGQQFCSAINFKNLSGCQFHPERSGEAGLRILRNFLYEIF